MILMNETGVQDESTCPICGFTYAHTEYETSGDLGPKSKEYYHQSLYCSLCGTVIWEKASVRAPAKAKEKIEYRPTQDRIKLAKQAVATFANDEDVQWIVDIFCDQVDIDGKDIQFFMTQFIRYIFEENWK